jgi:hypothetical protein
MTHMPANEANQEHAGQKQAQPRGQASEHGHTGEGAASVLAHLISQDEKQLREKEPRESADGEHP